MNTIRILLDVLACLAIAAACLGILRTFLQRRYVNSTEGRLRNIKLALRKQQLVRPNYWPKLLLMAPPIFWLLYRYAP